MGDLIRRGDLGVVALLLGDVALLLGDVALLMLPMGLPRVGDKGLLRMGESGLPPLRTGESGLLPRTGERGLFRLVGEDSDEYAVIVPCAVLLGDDDFIDLLLEECADRGGGVCILLGDLGRGAVRAEAEPPREDGGAGDLDSARAAIVGDWTRFCCCCCGRRLGWTDGVGDTTSDALELLPFPEAAVDAVNFFRNGSC